MDAQVVKDHLRGSNSSMRRCRLRRQAIKNVAQVRVRIMPVQPCRVHHAHHRAARCPARSDSANSQLERPMAIDRIWFLTQLLSREGLKKSTDHAVVH